MNAEMSMSGSASPKGPRSLPDLTHRTTYRGNGLQATSDVRHGESCTLISLPKHILLNIIEFSFPVPTTLQDIVNHPLLLASQSLRRLLRTVVETRVTLEYVLGRDEGPRPAQSWGGSDAEIGRKVHRAVFGYSPPFRSRLTDSKGRVIFDAAPKPYITEFSHYIACLSWPVRFDTIVIKAMNEWTGSKWPAERFLGILRVDDVRWKAEKVVFEGWDNNLEGEFWARLLLLKPGEDPNHRRVQQQRTAKRPLPSGYGGTTYDSPMADDRPAFHGLSPKARQQTTPDMACPEYEMDASGYEPSEGEESGQVVMTPSQTGTSASSQPGAFTPRQSESSMLNRTGPLTPRHSTDDEDEDDLEIKQIVHQTFNRDVWDHDEEFGHRLTTFNTFPSVCTEENSIAGPVS